MIKKNKNFYAACASLAFLIAVMPDATAMDKRNKEGMEGRSRFSQLRDHNYYKAELRKLEESTVRIHKEVDRILKVFRENMEEYYNRTRGERGFAAKTVRSTTVEGQGEASRREQQRKVEEDRQRREQQRKVEEDRQRREQQRKVEEDRQRREQQRKVEEDRQRREQQRKPDAKKTAWRQEDNLKSKEGQYLAPPISVDDYHTALETLGFQRNLNPTDAQVNTAYKKLALTFHPDRTQGDKRKEETFKNVKNAHQVIKDYREQAKDPGYEFRYYYQQGVDPNFVFRSHFGNFQNGVPDECTQQ
jgi:hypothetical protein